MKKVLYISRAGLPIDAAGVRTYHIGTLLEKGGYCVHYLANRHVGKNEKGAGYALLEPKEEPWLAPGEIHFSAGKKIYSYLPEFKPGKLNSWFELRELLTEKKAYLRTLECCKREKPEAIILYNDPYFLAKRLLPYCRKNGIRLYADVTEWYEKAHATTFASKRVADLVEKRILKLDRYLDGVIAISPYLKELYDSQGVACLQMPPLMEMETFSEIVRHQYDPETPAVNFVYAGSPGGKDILLPFVKAVQAINQNGIKARLDIVGIGENYFDAFPDVTRDLQKTGIFAHGRRSREETLEFVRRADFGILFRHDRRYAKAGFSTKFAEAMSVGVPMVCNSIGGCDAMITDGENGFLTSSCDTEALISLLQKITQMPTDEILKMKKNSYTFAKKHFESDAYFEALLSFMKLEDLSCPE